MNKLMKFALVALVLGIVLSPGAAFAAEGGAAPASQPVDLAKFGAAIAAGLIAIGAGFGIGKFAAAAADAIARQPSAAASITGAINLPLFLLEGVAIIGLVVCILAIFIK